MHIYSIFDKEFIPYGRVIEGYNFDELIAAMKNIDLPETGTDYIASIPKLEKCAVFKQLQDNAWGGMSIELGMCWGHNRMLNGLEYHRDSEMLIGAHEFILLLAMRHEIEDGKLSTDKVKAFCAPAGILLELYAGTMHYAPCHVHEDTGFRNAIVLPSGTNLPLEKGPILNSEDAMLTARNKWLLVHPDSEDAKRGCYIGLSGVNISLD